MSPDEKNDLLYVLSILEYVEKIQKYVKDARDAEDFFELNEQMNLNAVLNLFLNIGENISKISKSLKKKFKNINWRQIKDFRNIVVHNYMGVNIVIVFEIIQKDLPILKKDIINLIVAEIQNKLFDEQELKVAKGSKYYKHIPFREIFSALKKSKQKEFNF